MYYFPCKLTKVQKRAIAPARVLFVSTYPELAQLALTAAAELQLPMELRKEGIHPNDSAYAKENQATYDVIVSRSCTAQRIRGQVAVPVVSVETTADDYLRAFEAAGKYNKKVLLVAGESECRKGLKALATEYFGENVRVFSYENYSQLEVIHKTISAFDEGYLLMASGEFIGLDLKKKKMPYVLIRSESKAVEDALATAKSIVEQQARNVAQIDQYAGILNCANAGIIVVNEQLQITVCNLPAKSMLKLKNYAWQNASIVGPQAPEALQSLFDDGSFVWHKLVSVDDDQFLVNRVPVRLSNASQNMLITLQKFTHIQKAEADARAQLAKKGFFAQYTFDNIMHKAACMGQEIAKAKKFSATQAAILILGETGTGKELFAQSIHNASARREGPFVGVNCAALPESLLESELFGYEDGAFTGAKKGGKPGLFELADKGTIFLDEISEISPQLQARLLRVLQEKKIMRLGGNKAIQLDARIIAASNKNLYDLILAGKFRDDLYFRLNLLALQIPPLRERKEDIPLLLQYFYKKYAKEYQQAVHDITPETLATLCAYAWPGNIRELENIVERSVILCDARNTMNAALISSLGGFTAVNNVDVAGSEETIQVKIDNIKTMQQEIIQAMMQQYDGNQTKVADKLGISRVTVWKFLKG